MTAGVRPAQVGFHPPAANNSGTPGGFDTGMTSYEFKQWLLQNVLSSRQIIFSDPAQYTEPGTAAVDLASYTIPGGMLSQNGEGIEFFFGGVTAATANAKTFQVFYGGTSILTTGALAANNVPWYVRGKILRTAAQGQQIICEGNFNGALMAVQQSALAIDNTIDQILKSNATSATAAAGLTQTMAVIEKLGQFNISLGA